MRFFHKSCFVVIGYLLSVLALMELSLITAEESMATVQGQPNTCGSDGRVVKRLPLVFEVHGSIITKDLQNDISSFQFHARQPALQ